MQSVFAMQKLAPYLLTINRPKICVFAQISRFDAGNYTQQQKYGVARNFQGWFNPSKMNKHRCAQTRRKEIVTTGDSCNHWPFTLLKQQTDWHITNCDSSFIPFHGEIIQKFWLVSLFPYTLSLLSDWSHTYPPCSLIGQSEWAHTANPALWLVSLNEHMLLCEWAHNHGEIQS